VNISFIQEKKVFLVYSLIALLFYYLFAFQLVRSDFPKLIGLLIGLFILTYFLIEKHTTSFWTLAIIGVVFRLVFFPAIPNLSQDFYRFLWDGRLGIQGINPYLFTPQQYVNDLPPSHLLNNWHLSQWNSIAVPQAEELYNGMGNLNGSHYSNYPPINQLFFAIAAFFTRNNILGSVIALRVLIILADIGTLYFGKKLLNQIGLPVKNIFWYYLNPFIIIECVGNLHFEGVMLFFVVISLYLLHQKKWIWGAVFWGLSISVKLVPLLILPVFLKYLLANPNGNFRIKNFKFNSFGVKQIICFYGITLVTVVLTFAPFLSETFIHNFGATIGLWFQKFEFNASIYYIVRWIGFQTIGWNIIETAGKVLPLVVIVLLLLISLSRKNNSTQQLVTAMLFGISCYFLLSTTVHPWYIASPLLLSVFTKYRFAIIWSFVVMLSYSAYKSVGFSENLRWVSLEYSIVIGCIIWEIFVNKKTTVWLKKKL